MSEQLLSSLAVLIVYVIGGLIQNHRARKSRSALSTQLSTHETQIKALTSERATLQKTLSDQEVIIKDLRMSLANLTHTQILYETLQEGHSLLKADHDKLKALVAHLEAETKQLREALEKEQAAREQVEHTNGKLQARIHDLEIENKALSSALKYVGAERAQKAERAPEPGEHVADTPETAEE